MSEPIVPVPATGPADQPEWLNHVLTSGQSGDLMKRWRTSVGPDARQSAVLMLFGPHADGGEDLVLTQRADDLRKHPGQVSFPGGGVEEQDVSLTATALREAREEIGLLPDGVNVLGELAPIPLNVTNFVVNPVLAWWREPCQISALDPLEVARVARIPVKELVNPDNRFTATHPRGYAGPAFEVDDMYIWGFTAFVVDAVLTAGGQAVEWDVKDRRQVPQRFLTR